jgi:co-chaperonin GroES (HSP10)
MTAKKNHCGKSGGFILCDFRTGSPGNSAKVVAVGKIRVVQWAAQAEPEFPLECLPET